MEILKLNYKALRAVLAVLVISVSASGCTTKLAYNFLDWGLYWELKLKFRSSKPTNKGGYFLILGPLGVR